MRPIQTSKKIKVIHIYKDFDIYNGLIETFMLMADKFDPEKFDFKVCVFNHKNSEFARRFCQKGGRLDSLEAAWEDHPLIIWKLFKYLKKENPHIVQTYILKPNLYGRIAARLAGVPVVISTELTLRNQAPTTLRRLRDVFLHPLNSLLNRSTDTIICASEAIKRQWQTEKTEGKIQVVYPPFNMSQSRTSGCRKDSKPRKNGEWVIGIVGRLSEEKRHEDLLKAFSQILVRFPKSRLLIVGDGYLGERLRKLANDLGLDKSVDFAGFQKDVFKHLKVMDLFVLPSRTEGSPVSIFEAMSVGLPVVSTTVGGIPEVVVNGLNGILVPPCNPDALAGAIVRMLSAPETMRKMGEEGQKRVTEHFNPDLFIEKHETIYANLVCKKRICLT